MGMNYSGAQRHGKAISPQRSKRLAHQPLRQLRWGWNRMALPSVVMCSHGSLIGGFKKSKKNFRFQSQAKETRLLKTRGILFLAAHSPPWAEQTFNKSKQLRPTLPQPPSSTAS